MGAKHQPAFNEAITVLPVKALPLAAVASVIVRQSLRRTSRDGARSIFCKTGKKQA